DDAHARVERDERGEDGNPADVVPGGVDRIDDPAALARSFAPELFAEDRVVRPLALEALADGALHRLIYFRHGRAIGFRSHGKRWLKVLHGECVAQIG